MIPFPTRGPQFLVLSILVFVQFLNMTDYIIINPLAPRMMAYWAISPGQFSGLISSYSIGAAAGGLIGAFFVDRFARKHVFIALLSGFAVSTLACAWASSYWTFAVARTFSGMCGGSMEALTFAMVGDTFPENRRAGATGKIMAMFPLANIVGVPSGVVLAGWFDWRAPFFTVAALAVAALAVVVRFMPTIAAHSPCRERHGLFAGFRQVLAVPAHRRALWFTAVVIASSSSVVPYLATHLICNWRVSDQRLAIFYAVAGICTMVGAAFVGSLADRFGKRRLYCSAALLAAVPIALMTHLPPIPFPLAMLGGTAMMVLLTAQAVSAVSLVASVAQAGSRGRFMSINTTFEHLSIGATAMVAGALLSIGPGGTFDGYDRVGTFSVAAIAFGVFWVRRLTGAARYDVAAAPTP